jgi:ribosomal-protein-alanine N-acetyltransferase
MTLEKNELSSYYYTDGLSSSRIVTRFITQEDVAVWSPFFDDPFSVAYLPDYGLPSSTARAQHWIDRQQMRYSKQLYGLQAIIEKSTGNFLGQCGLITQEIDGQTEIEVGYHILKQYRGQGFAPEAARLFIDFAFDHHQSDSVISIIDVRNTNSQRVADKNGLLSEKQVRYMELDVFIYRINRSLNRPIT